MTIDRLRAIEMHRRAKGKIGVFPTINVRNEEELGMAYLPGSAAPSLAIEEEPALSFELTGKGNRIAVVTDGSSITGVGDISALASLPALEGKSLLYKLFGGIDAIPIAMDTKDADAIIYATQMIAPAFGAIALDDIAAPRTFTVLRELRSRLALPVFADDEQGTAVVVCAALFNALTVTKLPAEQTRIVVCGAGATGIAVTHLLLKAGFGDIVVLNSSGILGEGNPRMDNIQQEAASETNPRKVRGGLAEAVKGAHVFIGLARGGILSADLVRTMAPSPILFPMALPEPEISPEEAIAAGAAVIGTGLYDYDNVLQSLQAFPGIMRGVLDVQATMVSDGMLLAASRALAAAVDRRRLAARYIVPELFSDEVTPRIAEAVAQAAIEEGHARLTVSPGHVYDKTWQRLYGNSRQKNS
ncbi:MAG: NAD-dependent malic enzyme [Synergistales bacterium]|nr:NAD-dependent malic enzyme [Synergistales bacterium]